MKLNIVSEPWLVNLISVAMILVVSFFPVAAVRVVFGLPFVLFLPGHTSLVAVFPRKGQLGTIEILTFSVGVSLALVPLVAY